MRRLQWVDRDKETVEEHEELGLAAEAFLQNPLYARAMNELAETLVQELIDTPHDQPEVREHKYRMVRAVEALNDIFTGRRADAKLIAQAREQKALEEEENNG